jgi:phosphocarrier protein
MSILESKKDLAVVRQLVVVNKLGIHARPAAMFVKTASRFQSEITVEKDGEQVNGKSIMGLMMLAAGCGSKLMVSATGADAEKALDEIDQLFASRFNED